MRLHIPFSAKEEEGKDQRVVCNTSISTGTTRLFRWSQVAGPHHAWTMRPFR